MVEINNQRKGVPRYAGVVRGTMDVRKPEIIVMTSLWASTPDYSDHPHCDYITLNPRLKSTGADATGLLSRWWDAYRKQLGLKDFSRKSQDAVALQPD